MSTADTWKLLVFRDGRSVCSGPELLRGLIAQIEAVELLPDPCSQLGRDELIDGLLRAGELECALVDHDGCAAEANIIAEVVNDFSSALITKSRLKVSPKIRGTLDTLSVPSALALSTPEGFCYYALHPLDYADLLNEIPISATAAAVVGIRSIGATLSAVVCAYFRAKHIPAERITVRPIGHPFDRRLPMGDYERKWIARQNQQKAQFCVVDEGPGLSGSSFLAVAEALVEAGVPHARIILMPSSTPNPNRLFAPNAAQRWSRFQALALKPTRYIPSNAREYIGGGKWRSHVFDSKSEWPGVWPWTERQKYLSHDGNNLLRFDGHGHYGKEVRKRSEVLAAGGWGPQPSSAGDGFGMSPWLSGARIKSANRDTIFELARYCAFRCKHLSSQRLAQTELEQMAQINLERAIGVSRQITLPIERAVIADGRMMPYEWIQLSDGRLQKFDAADHGQNHFFPGPTDIAWDLAGAIVEWRLDSEAAELLVGEYRRHANDAVEKRLPNYLIAYAGFRMAFAQSAAHSASDSEERARLQLDADAYRGRVLALLKQCVSPTGTGASS